MSSDSQQPKPKGQNDCELVEKRQLKALNEKSDNGEDGDFGNDVECRDNLPTSELEWVVSKREACRDRW